ncbi:MAG: response regulator transcription factor [Planctomycetes bacterium]|nr:response regulator transcription factor [Planctomycetota bacterium]
MMRALVVEDDAEIVKAIEDTLLGLGHKHDRADNLQDARRLLEANHYDYVLLDLQIPAQPNRGFARIEHGVSLLEAVRHIKGNGRLPVIIMTAYHSQCLDQTAELMAAGASRFISKPFPESGRTLARVIQDVLDEHRRKFPDAAAAVNQPPKAAPFAGGPLAFYPDHIELCRETIVERTRRGHAWAVLHLLRERNPRGNHVRLSGAALAKAVNRSLGQNAIAQCVAALRERITSIMRDRLNLACGKHDVIDNRGGGYHLTPKIVVEVHDGDGAHGPAPAENVTGHTTGDTGVTKPVVTANVTGDTKNVTPGCALNERQKWVLAELARGTKITRPDVEKQFDVTARTVKRDLKDLLGLGLAEFVVRPRPGHYRLKER